MKLIPIVALSAFMFISCKQEISSEATNNKLDGTEAVDEHAGHNHEGEDHTGHDHGDENVDSAAGVKLNPPHGEPGHRCEIPVGAPLDGSANPATTPAPAQPSAGTQGGNHFLNNGGKSVASDNSNPYVVTNNNKTELKDLPQGVQPAMPGQQAPQTTAPGMQGKPNPAHGQPGHRCDVQVGQPLP